MERLTGIKLLPFEWVSWEYVTQLLLAIDNLLRYCFVAKLFMVGSFDTSQSKDTALQTNENESGIPTGVKSTRHNCRQVAYLLNCSSPNSTSMKSVL